MARVKVPITVIDPSNGNAIAGASVKIQNRASGTDATVFQAETGATTIGNPMTTDSAGRVSGWVGRGAFNAIISGTGITTYTQAFEGAPAADGSGETAWLATADWVTSLPSSPINGQEVFFLADPTNGTLWNLKYRAAAVSAYKWEFLGGGALYSIGTNTTITNTAYAAPSGAPTLTLPTAGYYEITVAARMQSGFSGTWYALASPDVNGAGAFDAQAAITMVGNSGSNLGTPNRTLQYAVNAAGASVLFKARVSTATGTDIYEPTLRAIPVRLG